MAGRLLLKGYFFEGKNLHFLVIGSDWFFFAEENLIE